MGTLALKDVEVLNLYVPSLLCAVLLGLEVTNWALPVIMT